MKHKPQYWRFFLFSNGGFLFAFRSWQSFLFYSSCSPLSLCLLTPSQSCKTQTSLVRQLIIPSWPMWRRCASLGSPWNIFFASFPHQTNGNFLKVPLMSSTCWPSYHIMSPYSSQSQTKVFCNSRMCGGWCKSFESCGFCASSSWHVTPLGCSHWASRYEEVTMSWACLSSSWQWGSWSFRV